MGFLNKDRLIEVIAASVILWLLNWIDLLIFYKSSLSDSINFLIFPKHIIFFVFVILSIFVLSFIIEQLKIKETIFVKGIKYYISIFLGLLIVLNVGIATAIEPVNIIKVLITLLIVTKGKRRLLLALSILAIIITIGFDKTVNKVTGAVVSIPNYINGNYKPYIFLGMVFLFLITLKYSRTTSRIKKYPHLVFLQPYVKKARKQGFTNEEIRRALLRKGWIKEDIDKLIK